jgi:hypothetical protein
LFTHAHTGRLPTMIPDTTWQLIIHVFTFSFEIYRCQALTYLGKLPGVILPFITF